MSTVSFDGRREVGVFLRHHRLQTDPARFPQLVQRRRHVSHLTQSDLAELADVSDAVVAQVENGRYENLNTALVVKLAVALELAPNQEQYLLNFLQPQNGNLEPAPQELPAMLRSVVDSSMPNPAMVITPHFDIVHWNENAARMLGDFGKMPPERRNIAVQMFTEPVMRDWWIDWEFNARNMVGGLRMFMSQNPVYREDIQRLALRLCAIDLKFREWWASVDPTLEPNRDKDFTHPEFGIMRIYQTVGMVFGSPHHSLLLFTPRDEETEVAFRRMAQ